MFLTKQVLENYGACNKGMLWYTSNGEPDSVEETIEKLLSSDEHKKFGWSNWLLSRVLPLDDKIRYAIFAAELVLDIFEKEYPNDNRPRNAIETAREYLSNKDVAVAHELVYATRVADDACADDAHAAHAAACVARAEAAYASARAAYAARDAAVRAADAAARAATDAAYDAACAAADAAADVASASRATDEAYVATYTKIINYGLSLVKKCDDCKNKNY